MKFKSSLYIFLAVFYFVGRIGFVSSPDVFNKTRLNRHINTAELPQSTVKLSAYVIIADRQKPQRLPAKQQQYSITFVKSQTKNFYSFPKTTLVPYKGVHIMPPPLLA